ncbi:MAG: YdeI/OmpD-associated family protein [Mycobacteriales bacterium]
MATTPARSPAAATVSAAKPDYPVLFFASQPEWESWLAAEHAAADGVWIKMARKSTGIDSIDWPAALEVALCYGWIDGTRKRLDDVYFLQKFTPRRARSPWSQINIGHVERLIREGRMQPAGQAEVDRAKTDGRWERAYASPSKVQVPADLQTALDANPDAAAFFATLKSTNRYAVLYRIQDAKRPETRARRIATFVDMLARGETLYPQ